MRVRPAQSGDHHTLLTLRCALHPDVALDRHQELLRRRADSPARFETFVAQGEDGGIVGFLELARGSGASVQVMLVSIYVVPGSRRSGVARSLLEAAERWAHVRGAAHLEVDLAATRSEAMQAMQWLGFANPVERVVLSRRVSVPIQVERDSSPASQVPKQVVPKKVVPKQVAMQPVAAAEPARGYGMLVINGLLLVLAVLSFMHTDIYAKDMLRGVLLPIADALFVFYFLFVFIALRYRRRADSSARADRLFRGDR